MPKLLKCKCCGANINRLTMNCEYCGAKYEESIINLKPMLIQVETPKIETLCVRHALDRYTMTNTNKIAISYLASEIADYMVANDLIEIKQEYSPELMSEIITARVRVVRPGEKF